MATDDTETRGHWWWRPGWRVGRSFYTWHILVEDQPELHAFARHVGMSSRGRSVLATTSVL
ncbi:hypothetical protein [Nonomuraea sp. NPDC049625]|uniref:hypothetical protein n=1 Tax=Nonomuraea sp. NPDC049625 TaxID=3155775 RepID=UPI00341DF62A